MLVFLSQAAKVLCGLRQKRQLSIFAVIEWLTPIGSLAAAINSFFNKKSCIAFAFSMRV
jgi:hypothetical protein